MVKSNNQIEKGDFSLAKEYLKSGLEQNSHNKYIILFNLSVIEVFFGNYRNALDIISDLQTTFSSNLYLNYNAINIINQRHPGDWVLFCVLEVRR